VVTIAHQQDALPTPLPRQGRQGSAALCRGATLLFEQQLCGRQIRQGNQLIQGCLIGGIDLAGEDHHRCFAQPVQV
jgi:hypothetical protein